MNVPNAVTLSESASKSLLAEYGVPMAPERLVVSPDAAVVAAKDAEIAALKAKLEAREAMENQPPPESGKKK